MCFSRELEEKVSGKKRVTCVIMNSGGENTNLQGGGSEF